MGCKNGSFHGGIARNDATSAKHIEKPLGRLSGVVQGGLVAGIIHQKNGVGAVVDLNLLELGGNRVQRFIPADRFELSTSPLTNPL